MDWLASATFTPFFSALKVVALLCTLIGALFGIFYDKDRLFRTDASGKRSLTRIGTVLVATVIFSSVVSYAVDWRKERVDATSAAIAAQPLAPVGTGIAFVERLEYDTRDPVVQDIVPLLTSIDEPRIGATGKEIPFADIAGPQPTKSLSGSIDVEQALSRASLPIIALRPTVFEVAIDREPAAAASGSASTHHDIDVIGNAGAQQAGPQNTYVFRNGSTLYFYPDQHRLIVYYGDVQPLAGTYSQYTGTIAGIPSIAGSTIAVTFHASITNGHPIMQPRRFLLTMEVDGRRLYLFSGRMKAVNAGMSIVYEQTVPADDRELKALAAPTVAELGPF